MKAASKLLETVRRIMRGHELWDCELPKLYNFGREWQIICGEGQFDAASKNAAYSKRTGAALNFQIQGRAEQIVSFEFCVAWPSPHAADGWLLMFHHDPERARWPAHPERHIQFQAPADRTMPPFASWRIPFGEVTPERIVEYLVSQIG
jgi:hypothetical protein